MLAILGSRYEDNSDLIIDDGTNLNDVYNNIL